jgi:hypothetical protein
VCMCTGERLVRGSGCWGVLLWGCWQWSCSSDCKPSCCRGQFAFVYFVCINTQGAAARTPYMLLKVSPWILHGMQCKVSGALASWVFSSCAGLGVWLDDAGVDRC